MRIIDKEYINSHQDEITDAIRDGKIFIYPTDTIYGLGCNALLDESVIKIRSIKRRDERPFSVAVPNKDWIIENCEVDIKDLDKYLPGPYTLFVKEKSKVVSSNVNPGLDVLGVRFPKHWFTKIIEKAEVPFVSTSVNISGEQHMENLDKVSEKILSKIDYVVYEGAKKGNPSKKIDLVS